MERPTIQEVESWLMTLYNTSQETITSAERSEQHKYATMVERPNDKRFLVKMLDESSQIRDDGKLAKRIKRLIDEYGVPKFLNSRDAFLFKMYQAFGYHFFPIAIPIIKKRLRMDTSRVIIDAARPHLTKHLATRREQRIGQNVNLLGEVVLGNEEADRRYYNTLEALKEPDINYISVKISGVYAQTHALNYEESFPELVRRMTELYKTAMEYPFVDENGQKHYKFVNLDMEEYKDAHLILRIFMETLSKPEFMHYSAGIVVQAYLADAWDFQTQLLDFAKERCARGGAPIKVRIVKGANLDMETVVSSLRGWPNPIRPNKTEVDANYLHLIERGLLPENAKCLNIGIASHNLYTISYAYLLTEKYGTPKEDFSFEMLEGMADHVWRAQSKLGNHVILYTPVVHDEHFLNAVSYLVRRMDENTAPDNFLTHSFNLKPGTKTWDFLKKQFEDAYAIKDTLTHQAKRTQNRLAPYAPVAPADVMANEPDTDFDREVNQEWQREIFKKWKKTPADTPYVIPTQIGDKEVVNDSRQDYYDRSAEEDVKVCEMSRANAEQVKEILEIAAADPKGWRNTTIEERHRILHDVANRMGNQRGDLIGCMCAVTGKTVVEGDVEVSESIDYARFYTTSMKKFYALDDVDIQPKGTILVISPWNFPCAIPCGGVAAALAAGNTVILKPASVAAPVAWLFAQAFWEAGVPKEALQVVITDREALNVLTQAPEVKHIILTGGTDTAQQILHAKPTTPLSAETGGKNAMIITASADMDHGIMNACHSAFGNAGQKCSACSLLLVERSVYNRKDFREKLRDCAISLKVGGVWDAGNIVGPMITNRNEKLLQAAGKLEEGESWLVEPRFVDKRKYIMAPAIKLGVKPENFSFRTELFGPLLSVAPFDTLEEAISLVNSLDYGLTSGLQTLDERERRLWRDTIEAGNLYINRGITGAIVNRQPFGGMKRSAFGPGLKAGGPNYCQQLTVISDKAGSTTDYQKSYTEAWKEEFSRPRDWNNCAGEQNVFRYLPLKGGMALRLFPADTDAQVLMVALAAKTCGTPLTVSHDTGERAILDAKLATLGVQVKQEPLNDFVASMPQYERIRTCSANIPIELYTRAAEKDLFISTETPVRNGRVELIHYLKEQSICFEYHRYGSGQDTAPQLDEEYGVR